MTSSRKLHIQSRFNFAPLVYVEPGMKKFSDMETGEEIEFEGWAYISCKKCILLLREKH
jgi:hypothetical protein